MSRLACLWLAGLAGVLALSSPASAQGVQMLAREPPPGYLRPGERALVDDGSCPSGQVKQVVEGSNRGLVANPLHPGVARLATCIPRPRP